METMTLAIVFLASGIIGSRAVRRVPPLLHTPLMSGMNALSGTTVLGAIAATAAAMHTGSALLGAVAVGLATINVVSGFVVTHRMLRMFRKREG